MTRIILKAVFITLSGVAILLFAGIWGQNQIGGNDNQQLLWAGIAGTTGIALSLSYSLRKRYWKWGGLRVWLRFHEVAAVVGTVIIFWHAGLRIHNFTGWLAMVLLLVLCASGIVGRYLHMEISREIGLRKKNGAESDALQQLQWWHSQFQAWRKWHIPLTKVFVLVLIAHLLATAFFGGWLA